jgi:hypothetical protein
MANGRANKAGGKSEIRQWTVMVYMAAGDSAEMDDYAVQDLREMQKGANDHVHVAVQIKRHWPDIAQRYVISHNGPAGEALLRASAGRTPSDMGDGGTLTSFLEWALEECPARHYMLVLWGHNYGLGFGRDHGDPLIFGELVEALDAFSKSRNKLERNRRTGPAREGRDGRERDKANRKDGTLEVLGANACALCYVEAAYELRESAQYLLASQIYVPFAGWPYDQVFQSISDKTSPEELGSNVVDSYVTGLNNPLTGERVQMSLLDLSHAADLRGVIDDLARSIRGAFKSNGQFDSGRRAAFRDAFIAAAAGDVRPLVDFMDLSRALKRDLCDPELRYFVLKTLGVSDSKFEWLDTSADNLERQLARVDEVFKNLIKKTAAHPSLALGGIGIYVPFVTDEQDLKRLGLDDDPFRTRRRKKGETSRTTYEGLSIFSGRQNGAAGNWPKLVYDDLNDPLPSELVDLIAGIGVTSAGDRAEIAQIVLSIESTFNKLDRFLDTAETVVNLALAHGKSKTDGPQGNRGQGLRLIGLAAPPDQNQKAGPPVEVTEPTLLEWFVILEALLEEIELTTKRGLTQARFGIGPAVSPGGFSSGKYGEGPPPRDDSRGFSSGKYGEGPPPRDGGRGLSSGKYGEGIASESTFAIAGMSEGESELGPAYWLFRVAADSLRQLECAASELERQAGESLGKEVFERRALGLRQAFHILCETATSTRRRIRAVIANPAYGLGPSPAAFDLDDREELAHAAGLSARNLLLLSVDPVTPKPDSGEFIYRRAVESARANARRVDTAVPRRRRRAQSGTAAALRRRPGGNR